MEVEGRLADALEYLEAARQNVRDLRDQLKRADARIAELEAACQPGEFHGCLTGDCPHENANECVGDLLESDDS